MTTNPYTYTVEKLKVYDAPNLRAHILNAASIETARGFSIIERADQLED